MAQILQGGGGALKPESKNLLPENVKAGQTIQILQGNKIIQSIDGTFTSDADIVASDIKQGKIAYSNGQKIVGTMPPYGPQTITPTTKDQSFGPGVYLAGQINIKGDSNLLPQNILTGKSIFGVAGASPRCFIIASGWAGSTQAIVYTPVKIKNASGDTVFKAGPQTISSGVTYSFIAPFNASRTIFFSYYQGTSVPTSLTKGASASFRVDTQNDRCVTVAVFLAND